MTVGAVHLLPTSLTPAATLSWDEFLREQIDFDWRPGEFDPVTLVYVPDPTDPHTYLKYCEREGCGLRVQTRLCQQCRNELRAALAEDPSLEEADWLKIARPVRHRADRTAKCSISACERTVVGLGLCHAHKASFFKWRTTTGRTEKDDWIRESRLRGLPAAEPCLAVVCGSDAHGRLGLCHTHREGFMSWKRKLPVARRDTATVDLWLEVHHEIPLDTSAGTSYAEQSATPFHLLPSSARWELLYAVQQRDIESGSRMVPIAIRAAYREIRENQYDSLVGREELGLTPTHSNQRGLLRDLQARIDEAYRRWSGTGNRGVYFLKDLEMTYSVHPIRLTTKIDLSTLALEWWADTVDAFILEDGPHGRNLLRATEKVAPIVEQILTQRGTPPEALGGKDIDAIVAVIRRRWTSAKSQSMYTACLDKILRFARFNDDLLTVWRLIPPTFAIDARRHRATGTPSRRAEDDSFRFIPQPIVDWLMDHLHLVTRRNAYLTAEARMLLYMQERCGRRTTETVQLADDCITYDSAGQAYLEWERRKPPYGRGPRLPIHPEVHDGIRLWQEIKRKAGITSKWLFPADRSRLDKPHSGQYLRDRVNEFVEVVHAIAPYTREVEDALGNLVFFDMLSIDPYALRHAFAQRHADATDAEGRRTVEPEVLQQWMGHANYNTTMRYYDITAARMRRVLGALPSRRLNLLGEAVPFDHERDSFGKIAVSLGTCTEPMNVAAGGEDCSFEHACESCPFFLVDPYERDGLEAKRVYLLGRIERLRHIAPESHMISHFQKRVANCERLIVAIDRYVDNLHPEDRLRIRQALESMADTRRRATAARRIDLRELLRETE